jgi:putative addiction module CopG family antidote
MAAQPKSESVSLSPSGDRFIRDVISAGRFKSPSEVVNESLRIMQTQEAVRTASLVEVAGKIEGGYEQMVSGELVDGEDVFAEIQLLSKAARAAALDGE